jgi:hypothetical protein
VRYVDFVQAIYGKIATAILSGGSMARNVGVDVRQVLADVGCDAPGESVLIEPVLDLIQVRLLDGNHHHVKLSALGRQVGTTPLSDVLWPWLFKQLHVEDEDLQFMAKAVELTEEQHEFCAVMRHIDAVPVAEATGRSGDLIELVYLFKRLHEEVPLELVGGIATFGMVELRVRYAGVVLATQQAQTELVQLVESLLPDWETVTVEFKREVHLDTKEQKADFVHDLAALATTKASGRRYLFIGWDPKSRLFTTNVDARLSQDRIEQVLSAYLDPVPAIRYRTFAYQGGTAGVVEAVRQAWDVPYRVKAAIHRLVIGDVFVRHGSQVEKPTERELEALIDEGHRGRNVQDGAK